MARRASKEEKPVTPNSETAAGSGGELMHAREGGSGCDAAAAAVGCVTLPAVDCHLIHRESRLGRFEL
eukprot:5929643-Prymnesium_polylepis.1